MLIKTGVSNMFFYVLVVVGFTIPLFSGDGDLDPSHGTAGIFTFDYDAGNDFVWGLAVQSDDKTVVSGSDSTGTMWVFTRINSDGTLDTTFDTDGFASVSGNEVIVAVAIQADGKIVACGSLFSNNTSWTEQVVRLNTDGSLDTTFGGTGIVSPQVGVFEDDSNFGQAVVIQADGKIVIVGNSTDPRDLFVARLNTDGSLDTSFSGDGIAHADLSTTPTMKGVQVQADGKIVASGHLSNDLLAVRLNSDGSFDNAFGTNGIVIEDLGTNTADNSFDLAIQSTGKLVFGGNSSNTPTLVRLNTDGTLDTSFDSDGIFSTGEVGSASEILVQSDDKIIMVGTGGPAPTQSMLIRMMPDGGFDNTFGTSGVVRTTVGGVNDRGTAVGLHSDFSIIVAGSQDVFMATRESFTALYENMLTPVDLISFSVD